jgi:hypothetical protein
MKKIRKNLNFILLAWIVIPIFLSFPIKILNYEIGSIKYAGWGSNADWHEEGNKSTTEVDVMYTETMGIDGGSGLDMLEQRMVMSYKDGTMAEAGFVTRIKFNPGGVVGGAVNNWSKAVGTEPTFYSSSILSNETVIADYKFNGFGIYKGNSTNLDFINHTLADGWAIKPNESKMIGMIDVNLKNYKVGVVTLSTNPVLYEGNITTQSIAEFDIIFNATIGNFTHTQDIQVIYNFEVKHMINETKYKFGVEVNWTGYEDFPTELNMNFGDDYFLVANDRLFVGFGNFAIGTFNSNAENDTAIFKSGNEEICRQYFTTAFKINLTGSDTTTNRFYLPNATYSSGNYGSQIYVYFDGFQYGQSSGISFDPTIVVPCTVLPDDGTPTPGPFDDGNTISFSHLFLGFFIISIVALTIITKKHKKTKRF